MSVGWNPTFTDVKAKTIEPWILHDYPQDFYGCNLRLLVAAYIRPEVKFESFDELIAEIKADGEFCDALLDQEEFCSLRDDAFFTPLPPLPCIDAVALAAATQSNDPAVQCLRSACLEHGFFVIDNHNVPTDLIDRAFVAASGFFALDSEQKAGHAGTAATNYRGYTGPGGGHNCSPNSIKPERKETFYCGGRGDWGDEGERLVPEVEGFDTAYKEFHAAMLSLSRAVIRGLSLSLDMPPDHLTEVAHKNPVAKVLVASYPPVAAGEMSCGAHTDCGFLTMLCSKSGRGLQVRHLDKYWISTPSHPYKFVCNLGDLAGRWTNDRYRSTPHRVLNDSEETRTSLIFFNNLDSEAVVEPLPSCVTAENPSRYEPVTCGAYVQGRLKAMRENYQGEDVGTDGVVAEPTECEKVVDGKL